MRDGVSYGKTGKTLLETNFPNKVVEKPEQNPVEVPEEKPQEILFGQQTLKLSINGGELTRIYNGKEHKLEVSGFDPEFMTITGNRAVNSGKYKMIISVKEPEKYDLIYKYEVGDSIEIDWKIAKEGILHPIPKVNSFEYTGEEIALEMKYYDESLFNVTGNKATEIGEYEAVISIKDKNNYEWAADSTTKDIIIKWKIIGNSLENGEVVAEIKTYVANIVQTQGGTIKINKLEVKEGESQTITIIPDEGYKIVDVKIDEKSVGAVTKYTLQNVKQNHKIVAVFEKNVQENEEKTNNNRNQFEDVKEEEWYFKSVEYVVNKGLFNGTSNNQFSPNATMNRAMLVTVLHRLSGENKIQRNNKFVDVEQNSYYEQAVIWASQNSIVSGVSETEFAPQNKITREQLVVMIYRYAKYEGMNVNSTANLSNYTDSSEISSYAKEAFAWAIESGYINGRSSTILAPKGTATRAEVATILTRFSK